MTPIMAVVQVQEVPASTCDKGYTYTKLDDTRWKCLTDAEAEKVYNDKHKNDNIGVVIAITFVLFIIIIGLLAAMAA